MGVEEVMGPGGGMPGPPESEVEERLVDCDEEEEEEEEEETLPVFCFCPPKLTSSNPSPSSTSSYMSSGVSSLFSPGALGSIASSCASSARKCTAGILSSPEAVLRSGSSDWTRRSR